MDPRCGRERGMLASEAVPAAVALGRACCPCRDSAAGHQSTLWTDLSRGGYLHTICWFGILAWLRRWRTEVLGA